MNNKHILTWAATILFFGGCAVGPKFKTPVVETPPEYLGSVNDSTEELLWWKIFNDTTLSRLIDRAVQKIYQPYFADPRPENMPILSDLHAALTEQHLPEADRVAQALDLYVSGSLNFFNNRTTVDIDNRFVCFDIKELPKNLKKPGMLVIQDQVWNRVTRNRNTGVSTWYYADEFHLLLKEPQTAAYSAEIWKRFRKWGGVPTGATQNVKDLLSSPEIENILENSDFICMLNQAAGDRKILAERLNISPEQLKFVTNSPPGEGLLFFENVILPFADKFPRDTELYRIMSTKPSEVNGV